MDMDMGDGSLSDEQREALKELFNMCSGALNAGIEDIIGREADIAVVMHLAHEKDEPCNGAVVLSNREDLEATHLVLTHGMVTIGKAIKTIHGGVPSATKH